MSFFDDKQEILKIELTTYGRYLLSRGKFRPAYYSFFDDDVLYDGQYGGVEETQNSIQTRILDESLSLKPQTTFSSIEDAVKLNTLLPSEIGKLKKEESQITADKNYALALPLGNSSHTSDYAPAWSFQMLNGSIDTVEQVINNSAGDKDVLQPFLKYPQINLKNFIYDIKRKTDSSSDNDYKNIASYEKDETVYYYLMKEQPLIFDLQEKNVDDLLKNFDVEVFMETEQTQEDGSSNKVFKQLNMKKDSISILNGILLDQLITFEIEEDETFVEYYFEMTIDDEISLPAQQNIQIIPGTITGNNGPFGNEC